jgi:organic hydroperoxide reductase OsmC/OhrA
VFVPRSKAPKQPRRTVGYRLAMSQVHGYRTRLSWIGSTAAGYERYERRHRLELPPNAAGIDVSADPAFRGDDRLTNPEQLLLAAASSCQMLSFLAIAARSGIDVRAYSDDAEAVMPEDDRPVRITAITLRPQIAVAAGTDVERVRRIVEKAHHECYIANSLTSEITIEPAVTLEG